VGVIPTIPLPSQEELRKLLDYDPETGKLIWKRRKCDSPTWNIRFAGKPALTIEKRGYFTGSIWGVKYMTHRIIWKWMTGDDPAEIDHINGNGLDNRWANLRSVDRLANARNMPKRRENKSGYCGVYFAQGKWQARILRKTIGTFSSREDAIAARKAAERELGFHPNHGRRDPNAPLSGGAAF
jgi:hypothetical protein